MCMPAECRSPSGLAGSAQLLAQDGVVEKKMANTGANPSLQSIYLLSWFLSVLALADEFVHLSHHFCLRQVWPSLKC